MGGKEAWVERASDCPAILGMTQPGWWGVPRQRERESAKASCIKQKWLGSVSYHAWSLGETKGSVASGRISQLEVLSRLFSLKQVLLKGQLSSAPPSQTQSLFNQLWVPRVRQTLCVLRWSPGNPTWLWNRADCKLLSSIQSKVSEFGGVTDSFMGKLDHKLGQKDWMWSG